MVDLFKSLIYSLNVHLTLFRLLHFNRSELCLRRISMLVMWLWKARWNIEYPC